MQTHFTAAQMQDPQIVEADKILRSCVHCGFCTATCPTFVITGDERDSPRGRIWMLREVLENPQSVSADTSYHIDRCLGCLSCTTTCPSGVDYPHLLDIGRDRLQDLVPRSIGDRMMRRMLAMTIPYAGRFRLIMQLAGLARLFGWALPASLRTALKKVPRTVPPLDEVGRETRRYAAEPGARRGDAQSIKRVVLLAGCAQRALDPEINASTVRLLNRLGVEVVVRAEAQCCGALAHHIGEGTAAQDTLQATIRAWHEEIESGRIDAIVTNASGCGTMVKDYGHLMKDDPAHADMARSISAKAMDVSELLARLDLGALLAAGPVVDGERIAYHSACSLQHGQKIHDLPMALLEQAGFEVVQPRNGHLCCGSAGVYNILQPEMADQLRERKLEAFDQTAAAFVAAGNIGCIIQLDREDMPVRHLVQYLDWATGGPKPF
jgi:glycolate oxidase iron-sulfur subunit